MTEASRQEAASRYVACPKHAPATSSAWRLSLERHLLREPHKQRLPSSVETIALGVCRVDWLGAVPSMSLGHRRRRGLVQRRPQQHRGWSIARQVSTRNRQHHCQHHVRTGGVSLRLAAMSGGEFCREAGDEARTRE